MKIRTVTITGADDSTDPSSLLGLSARYPFVEWGILLSRSHQGTPRYPSTKWIDDLCSNYPSAFLKLSGHLCGSWVRDLVAGENSFIKEYPRLKGMFNRVQLNFHGEPHEVDLPGLTSRLQEWSNYGRQFIFQCDGRNEEILKSVVRGDLVDAVPLFDKSGGGGVEPSVWPTDEWPYAGYAGGLHPARLEEQLERIAKAAGDREVWIDVETHVRPPDDRILDLDLVVEFLRKAETYINRAK